jgi:hypothetical protein
MHLFRAGGGSSGDVERNNADCVAAAIRRKF